MTTRAALILLSLALIMPLVHAQTAAECAAHLSPCHVDTRLYMAGIEDNQDMRDFLNRLKSAAQVDDRGALAGMVRYPLTIYIDGEPVKAYEEPDALREDFKAVFTPRVMAAIEGGAYETLFVNDQGAMIGEGELWLDGWDGPILIKAINP